MPKFLYSINAENEIAKGKINHYGLIDQFEVDAQSKSEAKEIGFTRFCNENPEHSHNQGDYAISCEMMNN